MVTIYDQFGRPYDLSNRKPETRELAVAPLMDSARDYVTDGLTPERLAKIFRAADAGDVRQQAELFELLEEKDGHLLCERDKRRNVITQCQWTVEPADDDQRSKTIADYVENWIGQQPDWDDNLVALQDAVGKGYSSMELFWEVSAGQAEPVKIEFIEQKRLTFTDENGMLSSVPRLLTDESPMGETIPAWRTIMHRYGGKSGAATRAGIYRVAAWMVLFKHYAIKDWLSFCELFGMPLRIGKYAQGATDAEKQALYAAIRAIGSDAAGIISKGTEIEFVESTRGSAATDLWDRLATFCNAEMSKALLGQTLTADVGSTGSYAAGKVHNEVRRDLQETDGRALAGTIRSDLIRPLVGFNFGWDAPLPKFTVAVQEEEDQDVNSQWVERLVNIGMPVPVSWAREKFSIPEPENDEPLLTAANSYQPQAAPVAAKTVVAKAENAPDRREPAAQSQGSTIETVVDRALADPAMDSMVDPIAQLLDQVDSLDELRDRLEELFAGMDPVELGNRLYQALMVAELSGRFDAKSEIDEDGGN